MTITWDHACIFDTEISIIKFEQDLVGICGNNPPRGYNDIDSVGGGISTTGL